MVCRLSAKLVFNKFQPFLNLWGQEVKQCIMKTLMIVLGLLLAWIGCENQNRIVKAEVREANAVWSNELASDGCSWHFTMASGDSSLSFAPSDRSLKTIETAVGKIEGAYSFTNVHMKYSLTGKKKNIQCGWGATAKMSEIDVLEIYKK